MSNVFALAQASLRMLVAKGGFDAILEKVTLISAGSGRAKAELTIGKEHSNVGSFAHGGFLATLVDSISTVALMTYDIENPSPGVSIDLSVQYFDAILSGTTVIIEAETVKRGRSIAFLTVDILDKNTRKVMARGSHIKMVSSPINKL